MRFITSHTRSMICFLMLVLGALTQPRLEAVTTAQTIPSSNDTNDARAGLNLWLQLRAARANDFRRAFRVEAGSDRLAMIFGAPLFAVITVNGTADGTLATLAGNSTCDLREAIQAANTNAAVGQCTAGAVGLDTIQFNLGAGTPTINVVSALPVITQQLIINGNTGGATRIELNGTAAGVGTVGLDITAGGSTINDLVINRFSGAGIRMQNGSGNVVQRCLIGTNAAGTVASANGNVGIFILNSSGHTIGGASGAGNVVSGNAFEGILLSGAAAVGNQILGNRIGTDITGNTAVGNGQSGIALLGAPSNTIGSASAGNQISGNAVHGISITNSNGTQIFGNRIGLNQNGNAALPNNVNGIFLSNSNNTVIGGTTAGTGNVISGNQQHGIGIEGGAGRLTAPTSSGNIVQGNVIGADLAGSLAIPNQQNGIVLNNANGNTIGGPAAAARNVISGNNISGISILGASATGNQVQGNFIGLNAAGTDRLANLTGVLIAGAPNNVIGGTATGAGNVISGNSDAGVQIDSAGGNQIQGNLIGTNAAGTAGIGNMVSGVDIGSADNNVVGGTAAGARNVISGNGSDAGGGIRFADGATNNQVLGNFIGTDVTGMLDLGNTLFGVRIFNSAANNVIGGTTAAARNIISGNNGPGVRIDGVTTTGNQLLGNFIGLNVAGAAALANSGVGVGISGGQNNSIGGTATGAGNVISGNDGAGVFFSSPMATGNFVQGNFIGTNPAGTAAFANAAGVSLAGASNNTIGGSASGAGNLISGNTNEGILMFMAASNNTIQGNRIGTQANGTSALGNGSHGIFFQSDPNNNNTIGGAGAAANTIAFNLGRGISVSSGTGNRITQNSIFSNGNRGIDLANNGLTPNDAGDVDTGPNNLQNFPVLASVSSGGVLNGSLDSLAGNSSYPVRIEFFANTTLDGCAVGEGETFLGFTTLAAPGAFTTTVTLVPGKNFISATAIDNNGNTSEFSACRQVNSAPTITAAAPPNVQQSSPAANAVIAVVADADQAGTSLMVTATPLTGAGVTISNLTISPGEPISAGEVAANVAASCTATNSTFTLTVTDNAGETATATLTVNVTPNTPPTLGVYPATNIATVGGSATVSPSPEPIDNGTVTTLTAAAPGFTGTLTGNPATGVINVTNAGPAGSYNVTVTATDNCNALSTANFALSVACSLLTVNSLNDTPDANVSDGLCADASGNCTLRAAIQEANTQACGNFINFSVTGTINLGSALPNLAANVTINGPGANQLTVRRNAGGNYGIFVINAGSTATINGLTISDGNAVSGGGVLNSGALTLNGCVVTNNTAQTGAGIFNFGGSLTITNSVISNNNATSGNAVAVGGGLSSFGGTINISNSNFSGNTNTNPLGTLQGGAMNLQDATTTLTNCTISGNQRGNIIGNLAGTAAATLTMTNCTVANNTSDLLAIVNTSGSGGFQAVTQLRNTLVAANSGQPNFRVSGTATLTSLGNNLDSDGSSGFTNGAGGNIVGTSGNPINARLAPLADNGGPVQTHAMRCDSPAIDAGTATGSPATDARGQSRNQDGNGDNINAVDIGALESQKYVVTTVADSGAGSLRQAISDNNAFGGGLIAFNIPGGGVQTIAPATPLPIIIRTVDINGYTQPGSSVNTLPNSDNAVLLIELSGRQSGGDGLSFAAGFSCVRGLTINQFSNGLVLSDGIASNNLITGNFIGTDPTGTAALPNVFGFVLFGGVTSAPSNNIFGGTTPAARNLLSGNSSSGTGTAIIVGGPSPNGNQFLGNFIGTNASGTGSLGNTLSGIQLSPANNTLIGDGTASGRNVISGNNFNGITISGNNNRVQGNFIGTDVTGTAALGNAAGGIRIFGNNNQIGGLSGPAGNLIAFNGGIGVSIFNDSANINNRINLNSIFSNAGLGIDLGLDAVTANDANDPDTGANNLQNFPVLTSVSSSGTINGSLDSLAGNTAYPVRIEFFANAACDVLGNGEGESFLGFTTLAAPGNFSFPATLIPGRNFITATATDANGNTSEFSVCRAVNTVPGIVAMANSRQQGSPISNTQIATVTDPDQPLNTLTVQHINGAASATLNGVTVSNLVVNAAGQVTADIIASCTAISAAFTLRVTDGGGEFSTATLNVTVTANTPPTLSYATPQNVQAGQNLTVNPATGPSDNGSITNIVLQSQGAYTGGITVNPTTGVVSLTGALPPGSHTITISATDNCGAATNATFTLNVTCPTITVSPTTLPGGTVGTGYSQTISATPTATYSFAVSAGSLPTGLTLNPTTGALTGTPMAAGTFNFTVTATSFGTCTGSQAYSVTIVCPTITLNPTGLPDGTTGTAYSQNITATGGTAPHSFAVTSGALPAGLMLSGAGALTGIPTQSGAFSFTVTATDANNCPGNLAYRLVIGCPPFVVSINQPPTVNAGQNFSLDVTVTNPCPDAALDTTLTTATPANTTFQGIVVPAGWTCTTPAVGATGAITCTNNSFAARPASSRATSVFTITLGVNASVAGGTVITTAVNVSGTAPGRPPVAGNAVANSTVANQAGLSVTKTAPATAVSGGDVTYNIAVFSGGPSPAAGVVLTDNVPAGTTFRSLTSPAGWTCTAPAQGGTGAITCNIATLPANQTANFTLTVRLNPTVACDTIISNTATVRSDTTDPVSADNTATATLSAKTQSDLSVNVAAPATGVPDQSAVYTVTVTNAGPSSSFNTTLNNALPPAFSAEAITPSVGTCTGIGTNTVNCNLGTLAVGATATIRIQAHVPETCQPTTAVNTATVTSGNCLADPVPANNQQTRMTNVILGSAGPGACLPAKSAINSTKPGSMLFAGLFTSGATGGGGDSNQNNTRVNLTNTHPTLGVIVHLFFVDGATCSISDAFVCLTANQTTSFFMSDLDPGTAGYMMLLAVDGPAGFAGGHNTGCPISFNYLIGNANIKFTGSPRRDIDLASESVASEFGSPVPGCDPTSSTAELVFDGSPQGYNQLPAVLAMDSIPSRADGNETMLMIGRIDGNWGTGLQPIGPIAGVMYDDTEKSYSFSFNVGTCLFRSLLSNNFPRTTPRFEQAIPAGRSGWLKFWSANGAALIGAMHVRNDNSQSAANAFEGGHNLHILRLLPRAVITVPVFPPSC